MRGLLFISFVGIPVPLCRVNRMSHADFLWQILTQKLMNKFSSSRFFSGMYKDDLVFYAEIELSNDSLINMLLSQKSDYGELLRLVGIEEQLVDENDVLLVLKQYLKEASSKELIYLIERLTPEKRIIKALSGMSEERKAKVIGFHFQSEDLINSAKNILLKAKSKRDKLTEEINQLLDVYELCKAAYKDKPKDDELILYTNRVAKRLIDLIENKIIKLKLFISEVKLKKDYDKIEKFEDELKKLNQLKKTIRLIQIPNKLDFGFEMIDFDRLVSKYKNKFDALYQLGKLSSLAKKALINERKSRSIKSYINKLDKRIDLTTIDLIKKHIGDRFEVANEKGVFKKRFPKYNLYAIHGESVIFEFYVNQFENSKYDGCEIEYGSHFVLCWLGDIIGSPDTERFIHLNTKVEGNGESLENISLFMNDLYIFDIYDEDTNEVSGIMNNRGDVILEAEFSELKQLSPCYFKAFNVKRSASKNWELFHKSGKQITKIEKNLESVEVDEEKGIITVEDEFEYDLKGNFIRSLREEDKKERYQLLLNKFFGNELLKQYKAIKTKKFSKWKIKPEELFDLITPSEFHLTQQKPGSKIFIYKDLYIVFDDNKGQNLYVVGIDPDLNSDFSLDEE